LPFLITVTIGTVLFLLGGRGGFMAEGIIPEEHGTSVPDQNLNKTIITAVLGGSLSKTGVPSGNALMLQQLQ